MPPVEDPEVAALIAAADEAAARGDATAEVANLWRAAERADRTLRAFPVAMALYRRIVEDHPSSRLSRGASARLAYLQGAVEGADGDTEPLRRFERVRAEYSRMDRDEARREVEAILREHPSFPRADELLLWLGDRALEEGRFHESRRWFERLIEEHPDSTVRGHALAGLGRATFETGDYKASERAYEALSDDALAGARWVSAREIDRVRAHVRREAQLRVVAVLLLVLAIAGAATVDGRRVAAAARRAFGREILYTGPVLAMLVLIGPSDARLALALIGVAGLAYLWLVLLWAEAARLSLRGWASRAGTVAVALLGAGCVLYTVLYALDLLPAVEQLAGG